MMRCMRFQSNKEIHLEAKEGVENMTITMSAKINKKDDNSPQSCRERPVLDHSTPVRQKHDSNKMEDSPDADYYPSPSPILLPCTQEGGNEVAWDWQSPLNKTPDSRCKKRTVQCETPKGTKLLQRKRNSNSPLLYKPLKRKTIKMENIQNIGQFSAELQALDKKIVTKIRESKKSQSNDCVKVDDPAIENNHKEVSIVADEPGSSKEVGNLNNANKANTNYDDLFDDSIDDSMAKCTQEIEEKFNLIAAKENLAVCSSANVKKEEDSLDDFMAKCTQEIEEKFDLIAVKGDPIKCLLANVKREESSCTDNIIDDACHVQSINNISKEISTEDLHYKVTNDNNKLNTYSRLSFKKSANSGIHAAIWKNKDLHKSYLNNNDTIHCYTEKPCDIKTSLKNKTAELFDIPDDSFDDCLATCVEDEKFSQPIESGKSRGNDDTKFCEANRKYLTHVPLKGKSFNNNVISENKITNSLTSATKVEVSTVSFLQNRKFFKTKSLSDQYIKQTTITNARNATNAAHTATQSTSCYTAKSRLNTLPKTSMISHTNVTHVSKNPVARNNREIEDNAISLTRSTAQTHGSNVNRYAVKENGERFVKYNSTGNIKNDTEGTTKTTSQPARCTAEEIEQKRLQAKMRREARRKLYTNTLANNINR